MSLNFQIDAQMRASKFKLNSELQQEATTAFSNNYDKNTNLLEDVDDQSSVDPVLYSNYKINYSYTENKQKQRAKSSYINKLSKVIQNNGGYQDKVKNRFFEQSSEITGVSQNNYTNNHMSWGLNKKSNNNLTLDAKPKVYDLEKYRAKKKTRPWSIDKSHCKYKNQTKIWEKSNQNYGDIMTGNSQLNLEINEENLTETNNNEVFPDGLFQKQNKKFYKPTKNLHVKQHIQMHRPYYTLKNFGSKINDSQNMSQNYSSQKQIVDQETIKDQKNHEKESISESKHASTFKSSQKLNPRSSLHQNSRNFEKKSNSICGFDNDDPYFKGGLKTYINLVTDLENKRRAVSSATTTYVLNKDAEKVQNKHIVETNTNRYGHLTDTYNEKILKEKLHKPPKEKQFVEPNLNANKKNMSASKNPYMKTNKFKQRPSSEYVISKNKIGEKQNKEDSLKENLPMDNNEKKQYMYQKQENEMLSKYEQKIVNLRDLRKRLEQTAIEEKKNKQLSKKKIDTTDNDFIKKYKQLNHKKVYREMGRIQKNFESPELFEEYREAFEKLDMQAEMYLKRVDEGLAEMKGQSIDENQMQKYIDDMVENIAKDKQKNSNKRRGGRDVKLVQTNVHKTQTFTELLTGQWEPDEKDKRWLNPLISYLKTAEDGVNEIKWRIKNYTNDVHWSIDELFAKLNNTKYLTQQQLTKIRQLFIAKETRQFFTMEQARFIDQTQANIPFFLKFDQKTRLLLIANSLFAEYDSGNYVYKEGDRPDFMYVVLYGSVDVILKKYNVEKRKDEDFVVASMSDGFSFGEYAIMGDKKVANKGEDKAMRDMIEYLKVDSIVAKSRQNIKESHSESNQESLENIYADDTITHSKKIVSFGENDITNENEEPANFTTIKELSKPTSFTTHTESKKERYKRILSPEKEKNIRTASIKVVESCVLLKIDQGFFQKVIMTIIKPELDEKLNLIKSLPFMKKTPLQSLMSFANLMKKEIFKMGDVIILEGEIPTKFSIIAQGKANLVYQKKVHRVSKPDTGLLCMNQTLRNKYHGSEDKEYVEKHLKKKDFSNITSLNKQVHKDQKRNFKCDLLESNHKDKIAYREHFVIDSQNIAQPIGLRTFNSKDIAVDGSIVKGADPGIKKANFSVVVDSSQMVIYSLEKKYIAFIPKDVLTKIVDGIKSMNDFDDGYDDDLKKKFDNWDKFKDEVFISTIKLKHENLDPHYYYKRF